MFYDRHHTRKPHKHISFPRFLYVSAYLRAQATGRISCLHKPACLRRGLSYSLVRHSCRDPYCQARCRFLRRHRSFPNNDKLRLLIGPEGGLDDSEISKASDNHFVGVTLGPRILRTETAALAALCILGSHFGDL